MGHRKNPRAGHIDDTRHSGEGVAKSRSQVQEHFLRNARIREHSADSKLVRGIETEADPFQSPEALKR